MSMTEFKSTTKIQVSNKRPSIKFWNNGTTARFINLAQ